MLNHIKIRNFKRFDKIDVDLGARVVFIGPNNSGKSTALQAIAFWDLGLKRWNERFSEKPDLKERIAVTINRNDLISMPVPSTRLLWFDLHVRNVELINKKQSTSNIRIDIIVDGITGGKSWSCGLEFDYVNPELFYCRPLRTGNINKPSKKLDRMSIPKEANNVQIAYLPPMSGLASFEPKLEPGRINVLVGEGQTAQILRNLCYKVYDLSETHASWLELKEHIKRLFGVELMPPVFNIVRGEITMSYKEKNGVQLDLSVSGRGLQQTILLLAYMYANPNTVLLLDEPDAHLEILRQRQTYQLLSTVAEEQGSQIIIASHSEVVLNEAAGRDTVVAFIGKPHTITDRGSQVLKSLKDIGYDQYLPALTKGWVLYLEGSSDLAILQEFASILKHPVKEHLEDVFVHYVSTNLPQKARDHFYGLQEAKKELKGIAIFDRLDKELHTDSSLIELMWSKREIENYFCTEDVLIAYARSELNEDDIFGKAEADRREEVMCESISDISIALSTLGKPDPWSPDIKTTDDFLDPLFDKYFKRLELPNSFRKNRYYKLARFVNPKDIDPEIKEKLDLIYKVLLKAKPSVY
ncbi:MAG: AAA family ATPase [Candidatus Hatepunaea meridiana]|nr:AAA family ATPase [Candidatus Hatepunaea meridiana]